ncbi:MAG TPA: erythromycin esterase family protein [Longimicrobiales bacterium]|nr:erythromycin esterase family protein [Longimicrobiales bacterium]
MATAPARIAAEPLREWAQPLTGEAAGYDPLMDAIGDARVVCLGEATHGTHEFYRERCVITRRLVEEKGFTAVAVEADWPDAYEVNRWVRGVSEAATAEAALRGFKRFPAWMWRNHDVVELVTWLRGWNDALPTGATKVGFYGLDLYSLFTSIEAVLRYLETVDPEAAQRARYRYSCFEHFGEDAQAYGYAATFGMSRSCEDAVVQELVELRRRAAELARRDGRVPEDAYFNAERNAVVIKDAEEYYRTMFTGRISSWNLRDRHMAETVDALLKHFDGTTGRRTRIVIWEHNSHVGDARFTDMGRQGEWTVGQLMREHYGPETCLVGFTTHRGTVTAASDWGAPAERKRVRPALPGSYEELLHDAEIPSFLLTMPSRSEVAELLAEPRLERAIGVIYLPRTERVSHYFHAELSRQFDAVVHFDETRAVEPLEATAEWHAGEPPETFPTGI